jgi:hypothetical protein
MFLNHIRFNDIKKRIQNGFEYCFLHHKKGKIP